MSKPAMFECANPWVWLGVEDVDALHEEYKTSGAKVRSAPQTFPWAKEMTVEDPDGPSSMTLSAGK